MPRGIFNPAMTINRADLIQINCGSAAFTEKIGPHTRRLKSAKNLLKRLVVEFGLL